MADATPAPTTQASHVFATARPFPPGLVPVAMVIAVAVGLLSLLPSLAQAVWEVPHLFVLGLVISYGVFTQRNTDGVDQTGHSDGGIGAKEGAVAWNARYRPDEPLIVVADSDRAREGAMEMPVSLPVRRLKPATQESETSDANDVGAGEEETGSSASSAGGFCGGGAYTAPSPPSVLDADLGLSSPCSPQAPSPPFSAHSSAASSSRSVSGYPPCTPQDETSSEDGEVTDWDEEEADDQSDDMMTVSSERSVRGTDFTACANNDRNDDDDDTSVDDELQKLASKAAAPDREDEVDRKADAFIAKFREQIRLQRL